MSGRASGEPPTQPVESNLTSADPTEVGPYRVLRRLGAGGMGTVYLAEDAGGHQVAVKIVRSDLARLAAFRNRFKHEADNARRVARFCTAAVLDVDVEADPPYLVTEYVDGPTLSEAIANRGPLTSAELHQLAVSMTTALMAIHRAGIVHRDLKPSNILLSRLGPKVIDFGIARALDTASVLSQDGRVGTPAFMAPEQARGETVTSAADVFAWGGVLLYAGTGRYPFGTGSAVALLYRTVNENPEMDGFEPSLRPLVEAAMRKVPTIRPTAEQLYARLLDLRVDVPVAAADLPLSEVTMLIRPLPTPPGDVGTPPPATGGVPASGPGSSTGTGTGTGTGTSAYLGTGTGPTPYTGTGAGAGAGQGSAAGLGSATGAGSWPSHSGPGFGTGTPYDMATHHGPGAARTTHGGEYGGALSAVHTDPGLRRPAPAPGAPPGPQPRFGQRGRLVTALLVVLAIFAAVAVALTLINRKPSVSATSIADTVAAKALRLQSQDPAQARRLALAAYLTARDSPTTRDAVITIFNDAIPSTVISYDSASGDDNALLSAAFSPDGRHVAAGAVDGTITLWDVSDRANPTVAATLTGHTGYVTSLSFNRDGTVLASGGSDHTVRLWNLNNLTRARQFSKTPAFHTDEVRSVAFSPDGNTLASAGADDRFALWAVTDPAHPTERSHDEARTGGVWSVAFDSTGTQLALGGNDGTVGLWDIHNAAVPGLENTLRSHDHAVQSVAFGSDGTLVSGGIDRTVQRWNVSEPSNPVELAPLPSQIDGVNSVAFSPDGSIVAAASDDKTVRLSGVTDRMAPISLVTFTESSRAVSSVTFSPDGKTVLAASRDGRLRLWEIDPEQLAQAACRNSENQITSDEWAQNFGTMDFRPGC